MPYKGNLEGEIERAFELEKTSRPEKWRREKNPENLVHGVVTCLFILGEISEMDPRSIGVCLFSDRPVFPSLKVKLPVAVQCCRCRQ